MKKRILSLLLTICMVLPVFQVILSATDQTSDESAFGELNLIIKQPLAAANKEFKAELYREGNSVPEYSTILSGSGASDVIGSISGIVSGTYLLRLTAPKIGRAHV